MKLQRMGNVSVIQDVDPPIQVIVLDNDPFTTAQPSDYRFVVDVINRFDISVCKCAIPNMLSLEQAITTSRSDIVFQEMEYDM